MYWIRRYSHISIHWNPISIICFMRMLNIWDFERFGCFKRFLRFLKCLTFKFFFTSIFFLTSFLFYFFLLRFFNLEHFSVCDYFFAQESATNVIFLYNANMSHLSGYVYMKMMWRKNGITKKRHMFKNLIYWFFIICGSIPKLFEIWIIYFTVVMVCGRKLPKTRNFSKKKTWHICVTRKNVTYGCILNKKLWVDEK